MNDDEQRAAALLREVIRDVERDRGQGLAAEAGREMLCRVYRAARDAAEAVRILELHRCTGGLTSETLMALQKYKKIYEASELILVKYFSRPEDLTPAALEVFFEIIEDA